MLLSVVIPFHLNNALLERAILSIVKQSHESVEVILVGDGLLEEDIKELRNKYPSLIFILIPSSGANTARMRGISQSKGQYILFMDSDDTLPDGAVKEYLSIIEQVQPDLIIGNTKRIAPSGSESTFYDFKRKETILDKHSLTNNDLYSFPVLINKCFRKIVMQDVVLLQSAMFQDAYITATLFLHVQTVYYTNLVLYNYYEREESTSRKSHYSLTDLASVEHSIDQLYAQHTLEKTSINKRFISIFCARLYYTLALRATKHEALNFNKGLRTRAIVHLRKNSLTLLSHTKTAIILLLFSNAYLFKLYFQYKLKNKAY